jgi:hypothetical protein
MAEIKIDPIGYIEYWRGQGRSWEWIAETTFNLETGEKVTGEEVRQWYEAWTDTDTRTS